MFASVLIFRYPNGHEEFETYGTELINPKNTSVEVSIASTGAHPRFPTHFVATGTQEQAFLSAQQKCFASYWSLGIFDCFGEYLEPQW